MARGMAPQLPVGPVKSAQALKARSEGCFGHIAFRVGQKALGLMDPKTVQVFLEPQPKTFVQQAGKVVVAQVSPVSKDFQIHGLSEMGMKVIKRLTKPGQRQKILSGRTREARLTSQRRTAKNARQPFDNKVGSWGHPAAFLIQMQKKRAEFCRQLMPGLYEKERSPCIRPNPLTKEGCGKHQDFGPRTGRQTVMMDGTAAKKGHRSSLQGANHPISTQDQHPGLDQGDFDFMMPVRQVGKVTPFKADQPRYLGLEASILFVKSVHWYKIAKNAAKSTVLAHQNWTVWTSMASGGVVCTEWVKKKFKQ